MIFYSWVILIFLITSGFIWSLFIIILLAWDMSTVLSLTGNCCSSDNSGTSGILISILG